MAAPYHHGDLRRALVVAAREQIEAQGADEFSLRETARRVGVSANAAYRHFTDRDALLAAVAAAGFGELSAAMVEARAATKSPVAAFRAVGRAYIEFALRAPALFRVMFTRRGPETLPREAPPSPTPYELLGQALDALVVNGELSRAKRKGAELKAWTVVHGYAQLLLDGMARPSSRRELTTTVEDLLAFVVEGLVCRTREGKRTRRARPSQL